MTTKHEFPADLDNYIAGLRIENINLKLAAKQADALLKRATEICTFNTQDEVVVLDIEQFLASQQGEQCPQCDGSGKISGSDGCGVWYAVCQTCTKKHPEQAEGAQGEREAFEAHESRERRLSPADQKFWFRRGAVADYDIKSINDAWKAWKARAALAQPALQCKKCGGTGDADSGGIHPWGEAAMVPCDCAHTELEAFETHYLALPYGSPNSHDLARLSDGSYKFAAMRQLWEFWQARAALARVAQGGCDD